MALSVPWWGVRCARPTLSVHKRTRGRSRRAATAELGFIIEGPWNSCKHAAGSSSAHLQLKAGTVAKLTQFTHLSGIPTWDLPAQLVHRLPVRLSGQ